MRRTSSILFAFLAVALVRGQDDSKSVDVSVETALSEAKEMFISATELARAKFVAAFESREMELTKQDGITAEARAALIREVQAEKKAFVDDEKLPKSESMKGSLIEYKQSLALAVRECEAAYDKAVKAYQSKKNTIRADEITAEKKELLAVFSPSPDGKPGQDSTLATFKKGSVWRGQRVWDDGQKRIVRFEVTQRDGTQFKGIIAVHNNTVNQARVEGTIRDGRINWHQTKKLKGGPQLPVNGRITANSITVEGPSKVWTNLSPVK